MTSRIGRWTGIERDNRSVSSKGLPQAGTIDPRLESALKAALAALEAALAKRKRADRQRHTLAGIEAIVGVLGLCGLVTMLVSQVPQVNLVLVGLLSVAAAVPIFATFARATADGRRETEEIAAVEAARAIAVQTAGLARTFEVATLPAQGEPAGKMVADEVLAHIEHSAAALQGRERRVDIDQGLKARRHVRIKPTNERIAVTMENGITIIAQLVDVSISGAMIAGSMPDVRAGDEIRVGSRAATVVRTTERGVACEFVEPLPALSLAPNLVL